MSKRREGKYEPSLVYASLIKAVAEVRRYGINKYGKSDDWRTTPSIEHFDALLRHVYAYMRGESVDKDSGLSHLAHAAANIMFEIERREPQQGDKFVDGMRADVVCPRCKSKDSYPLTGVHPCTSGCGYFIEPELCENL